MNEHLKSYIFFISYIFIQSCLIDGISINLELVLLAVFTLGNILVLAVGNKFIHDVAMCGMHLLYIFICIASSLKITTVLYDIKSIMIIILTALVIFGLMKLSNMFTSSTFIENHSMTRALKTSMQKAAPVVKSKGIKGVTTISNNVLFTLVDIEGVLKANPYTSKYMSFIASKMQALGAVAVEKYIGNIMLKSSEDSPMANIFNTMLGSEGNEESTSFSDVLGNHNALLDMISGTMTGILDDSDSDDDSNSMTRIRTCKVKNN